MMILNVRAHTGIIENVKISELANERANKDIETLIPHIHIAHITTYWVNGPVMATHKGKNRNLHTYIIKEHKMRETTLAKSKFTYVDK